jgi:hypothetical protein
MPADGLQRGRARAMLPKTNFPNSMPTESQLDRHKQFFLLRKLKKWPFGPMHNEKLRVQQKATSVIA